VQEEQCYEGTYEVASISPQFSGFDFQNASLRKMKKAGQKVERHTISQSI